MHVATGLTLSTLYRYITPKILISTGDVGTWPSPKILLKVIWSYVPLKYSHTIIFSLYQSFAQSTFFLSASEARLIQHEQEAYVTSKQHMDAQLCVWSLLYLSLRQVYTGRVEVCHEGAVCFVQWCVDKYHLAINCNTFFSRNQVSILP